MEDERKLIKLKDGDKLMSLEEVYEQFKRFLYKQAKSYIKNFELEDLLSIAYMGLQKAYVKYDAAKGVLFMTYLSPIVFNELRMHYRKEKKHFGVASLDEAIPNQKDSRELATLLDTIDDDIDYAAGCIDHVVFNELQPIIDSLSDRDRKIFLGYYVYSKSQPEIAAEIGTTQSYVSRLLKRIPKTIREKYERGNNSMNGREPKVTKEQLLEAARLHGTSEAGVIIMSAIFSLTPTTIRTYLSKYGISKALSSEKAESVPTSEAKQVEAAVDTIIEDTIQVKAEPIQAEEPENSFKKLPKNSILKPLALRGKVMEYSIQGSACVVKSISEGSSLLLNAADIDDFILELQALKEVL